MINLTELLEFLEGDEKEYSLPFIPLDKLSKTLHDIGFNTLNENGSLNLCNEGNNEYDYNGWQIDFWWVIHKDNKKYSLQGSLFYGEFKLIKL